MYHGEKTVTLQEKGKEGNHEHQEDTNDATFDPLEHGSQLVTTVRGIQWLSSRVVLADGDR